MEILRLNPNAVSNSYNFIYSISYVDIIIQKKHPFWKQNKAIKNFVLRQYLRKASPSEAENG